MVFASEGLQYLIRKQAETLLQRYSRELYYGQTDQIKFAAKLFVEKIKTELATMYGSACVTRSGDQVVDLHSRRYIDMFIKKLHNKSDEQIEKDFRDFAEGTITIFFFAES